MILYQDDLTSVEDELGCLSALANAGAAAMAYPLSPGMQRLWPPYWIR